VRRIVGDEAARGLRGSGLHEVTCAWFAARFDSPSPAQAKAWPHILASESTLISAPTGSGKTLAAFLCAIDRLMFESGDAADAPAQGVRVLYISPVKALAKDVERNLQEPLAGIRAFAVERGVAHRVPRVAVRSGDTPQSERQKMRRDPPEILITTPESLFLILTSEARSILRSVETVIVDEIHAIVGTKRGAHLALSVERVARLAGRPVQRIGLSATSRPLDLVARYLAGTRGPEVHVVDASRKRAFDIRVESAVADMTALPREPIETAPEGTAAAKGAAVERPWMGSGTSASGRGLAAPAAPDTTGTPATDPADASARSAPSILPAIHRRVLALILEHRSTIVFVNSRRSAERFASALNELAGESGPICRAHHGSLAKEERELVEAALKDGRLRAVVATSSLELGIDMGLVNLVVQIETPPSVSSAIQRIGRASHQVGGVPKALVFPTYRGDLLAAAATIDALQKGDIEPVTLPRNPLDVLAQQVLSILVEEPMDADALFALVRGAASFSTLPRAAFDGVLDMLAGRYPSRDFSDLRPRIVWNRDTGELRAREGVRMTLFANAGTIPDRGLFTVYLAESRSADAPAEPPAEAARGGPSRRVGELDEEMVFESRVGDIVMLGASSWRIDEIQRDRVMVRPAPGLRGRMPFWKADRPPRPFENAKRIGALSRTLLRLGPERATALLRDDYTLEDNAATNLAAYVHDQSEAGVVPTDETMVLERGRDEMGDLRLCLLSSFGGRVHQPLALAMVRKLKQEGLHEVEVTASDDGIILRLPDREDAPTLADLLPSSREVEALVREELSESTLFAARFREAAGRSLLLPRRRPGSRSPLWAQRQKAHALLSVASHFPAFPLILEAYRECLVEDFDVEALVGVLRDIEKKKIRAVTLDAARPTPFASALLFGYVATVMYDDDAPVAERRAHALSIDESQLQALLGETAFQDLLDPSALAEVHAELQRTAPSWRIRSADGLHDALTRLGDLSLEEIAVRAADPAVAAHADDLLRDRRALEVRIAGEERLIAIEDAGLYRDALGIPLFRAVPKAFLTPVDGALDALIVRYARTRGPFATGAVASRYGLAPDEAFRRIEALEAAGQLIRGPFTRQPDDDEWCDVDVLRRIRRLSLAKARGGVAPVERRDYARFLLAWHGLGPDEETAGEDRAERLVAAIDQLQGVAVPASALEADVLPARVPGYRAQDLDLLAARGEIVLEGRGALGARDGKLALYFTPNHPLFGPPAREPLQGDTAIRVREALAAAGAPFVPEIEAACPGLRRRDIVDALWALFWNGEVTVDSIAALRGRISDPAKTPGRRVLPSRFGRYRSRVDMPSDAVGRFSILSPRPSPDVPARLATLEQWLARHGVLTREAIAAEAKEGGFSAVYPILRALEERGQIRRGYFIEGLGALQFADPAAVDRMREVRDDVGAPIAAVLASTDPANPFGVTLPWPAWCGGAGERRARTHVVIADGALIALLQNDGERVTVAPPADADEPQGRQRDNAAAAAMAAWMRRRALRIIGHDAGEGAEALNRTALAPALRGAGLQPSGPGFRL
jgi:ATP-dependent Lhr-like helicase